MRLQSFFKLSSLPMTRSAAFSNYGGNDPDAISLGRLVGTLKRLELSAGFAASLEFLLHVIKEISCPERGDQVPVPACAAQSVDGECRVVSGVC